MTIETAEFEKIFLLFAMENPNYLENVKRGFFSIKEIDVLGAITKAYYDRYKQIPTKEQLWMMAMQKEVDIKEDFYDKIFEKPLSKYDIDWVKNTAESWILWKNLDSSLTDTLEYVSTQKVTPDNVGTIVNTVKDLIVKRNSVSFDDDLGLDFFSAADHELGKDETITTNYNFMDKLIGGYGKQSLNVYVAPPNAGKSLIMCHDAAEYLKKGKNVLYITLEMSPKKIFKRVGSKVFGIPISEYDQKSRNREFMESKIKKLKSESLFGLGQFRAKEYPSASATPEDIEAYVQKVEETTGIKFDVLIIDYINILRDRRNPNTENTYLKIKNISEDLRALAQRQDLVIITATQTNRSGIDSSEVTMSSIAESAGLSHTADNIIAIIQTPDMNLDRIYWLKLLKVRDGAGKHTKCKFNIDYEFMTLSETDVVLAEGQEAA